MSSTAIDVKAISKVFRLGQQRGGSLREALVRLASPSSYRSIKHQLWALKEVTFSVQHGSTYGIIGGNGAGKSTLLKVLTGITRPTAGTARINGRIGSLLEVGSSFHSELSGRENIYLNGAVLGMKKAETHRRLDEIVAFAEVEDFLETPVKHYSSGMYVRLAFSIAAHLDLDVLIVDEVLSVGDASFQQRSLEKIRELARSGRTILFTSHDMNSVRELCDTALWLRHGEVALVGETGNVVDQYLAAAKDETL